MAILLNNSGFENAPWAKIFAQVLPELPVYEFPNVPDPQEIKYAVVWEHPHNDLQRYQNLRAILVLGAGTDHIDKDPALEQVDIPIVRLIDPDVGVDMAHYVLYWAMHFQRGYQTYIEQAEKQLWQRNMAPRAVNWRVTVLGLGRIGAFVAKQISQAGFVAQAWNRSAKEIEAVKTFSGKHELAAALSVTDVLVNCLPLNDETNAFLNKRVFAEMPKGGYFINISRGAVVEEEALIDALESRQLAGAALDCFAQEPLPSNSPFWHMHHVYVTPHMSGSTYARSAAIVVANNIQRLERGENPYPIHAKQPGNRNGDR